MIPVRPGKIVCIGRNYAAHAKELGNEVPPVPMLFFKPTTALIGPGDPIRLPAVSRQVEFEAEIGVVIGARLHDADVEQAERGSVATPASTTSPVVICRRPMGSGAAPRVSIHSVRSDRRSETVSIGATSRSSAGSTDASGNGAELPRCTFRFRSWCRSSAAS